MAAIRYCGTLKLRITYIERDDTYTVTIREIYDDARFPTQKGIRLSSHDRARTAGDSSAAYDKVARAAISFCGSTEDGGHIYSYTKASNDDGDNVIRRSLVPVSDTTVEKRITPFDDARNVQSIGVRLASLDVGFNLRAENTPVRIPRECAVASYDLNGERYVVEGPAEYVVETLRAAGYTIEVV